MKTTQTLLYLLLKIKVTPDPNSKKRRIPPESTPDPWPPLVSCTSRNKTRHRLQQKNA